MSEETEEQIMKVSFVIALLLALVGAIVVLGKVFDGVWWITHIEGRVHSLEMSRLEMNGSFIQMKCERVKGEIAYCVSEDGKNYFGSPESTQTDNVQD